MIKRITAAIPMLELRDLARLLIGANQQPAAIADAIVELADVAVDWRKVVPGRAGEALEAQDGGPIVRAVVRFIVAAVVRREANELAAVPAAVTSPTANAAT